MPPSAAAALGFTDLKLAVLEATGARFVDLEFVLGAVDDGCFSYFDSYALNFDCRSDYQFSGSRNTSAGCAIDDLPPSYLDPAPIA